MADPSQALIVAALTRALAAPNGLPFVGGKTGLFAASATGKRAAEECRSRGLIRIFDSLRSGNAKQEFAALSDEGVAFLLRESNPRPILEAINQAIVERGTQLEELLTAARQTQTALTNLQNHARSVLDHLERHESTQAGKAPERNGKHDIHGAEMDAAILEFLRRWQERGVLEDCPLPEVYRDLAKGGSPPSIGQFHDSVRRQQNAGRVYMHPWTGPLYEIPEPALALLVGHEVAYYASLTS